MNEPDVTDNWQAPATSAPASGWVVRAKRWDVEAEQHEYFRSPKEPLSYTKELAIIIYNEMKRVHSSWEWEIIQPNDPSSGAA